MSERSLDWAMPVMRTGYAGRGLVYVIVAGISLFAIWRGGQAQGTSDALAAVESSPFGKILLTLVALGLFAYMIWRLIDAYFDLEDKGTDAKGIAARIGQAVTGLIHGALGVLTVSLMLSSGGGSGGSKTAYYLNQLMAMPGGNWVVGIAGVVTMGAGVYYLHKAWSQKYLQVLRANHFTMNWNQVLRAGVAAQGATVLIIGYLILRAARTSDGSDAGGLDKAFGWLSQQTYGQLLVTAMCLGLLGFALFMFVNAMYRIVPRLKDPDVSSVAREIKAKAS
ncbi:DUF1206 domain-containing protein [Salipiger sp. IMCC34102]|uniref:DUF1206 domain-containing protein n=1 Tax=Salipiger sp. IMCC34102 TaxID=2510647 RepID=UPI00101B9F2C|nr:DUF1206 domain-containing protein [Salipiger sp. IMCC34102]RYH03432.1 DUF1206 domain-containing protein [Salipiger sp. IMCC34102]